MGWDDIENYWLLDNESWQGWCLYAYEELESELLLDGPCFASSLSIVSY